MNAASRPPLRVVEIAQGIAGPALGRIFAALGNDVVKCEPPEGDRARASETFGFAARNAGKRSIALDFAEEKDRGILHALLDRADILIADLPTVQAAALGIAPDRLQARWPGLIAVFITSLGLTEPETDGDEDCLLAEARGGLVNMVGEHNGKPLSLGGHQAAYASAYAGFLGASIALCAKARHGRGEVVDVALADVAAFIDWKSDIAFAATGQIPQRVGVGTVRWRMIPAADGWVGVIYQAHQWPAIVSLVGDALLDDPRLAEEAFRHAYPELWWPAIERWAAWLPKHEIHARAQALRLPFGYCADVADLIASSHLKARGFVAADAAPVEGGPIVGPLVVSDALPWRAGGAPGLDADRTVILVELATPVPATISSASPGKPDAPLKGVNILDFGTITAGAATTRLLADYGATVVKVESPDRPDSFRRWTLAVAVNDMDGNISPLFDSNNAGKRSVALDLKSEEGRRAIGDLAAASDMVVENFRVGVTERLGIDHATLAAVKPDIIYLSLSSQGQQGPEARNSSYGSTLDLLSGIASITGYDAAHPLWSSSEVNYPDQIVALFGAGIAAYALFAKAYGAWLDVSQLDLAAWTLAEPIGACLATGMVAVPTGNHRRGFAPHDCFACADGGWIALSCARDSQRVALAALIDAPDLAGLPLASWEAMADSIDARLTAWAKVRDRSSALAELTAAGVPCAPVHDARTRAADPHFLARGVFRDDPVRMRGYPFRLAGYQPPAPARAPALGADNDLLTAPSLHRSAPIPHSRSAIHV